MSKLFSEEVIKWNNELSGMFLKSANFQGEGLTVQMIAPVKRVPNTFAKGENDHETNEYTFQCADGVERTMTNGSKKLVAALVNANMDLNDYCVIKVSGEGFSTSWEVTRLTGKPVGFGEKKEDLTSSEIPF